MTDSGHLVYYFNFMDPSAEYATLREAIEMSSNEIAIAAGEFEKVENWSNAAQENGIRKRFDKRAVCFPSDQCGDKRAGVTSTEVVFLIYEYGSTAAKVQRNKSTFSSGYNFSVESAMLLAAYLDFMKEVGGKEFVVGSMIDTELDAKFE